MRNEFPNSGDIGTSVTEGTFLCKLKCDWCRGVLRTSSALDQHLDFQSWKLYWEKSQIIQLLLVFDLFILIQIGICAFSVNNCAGKHSLEASEAWAILLVEAVMTIQGGVSWDMRERGCIFPCDWECIYCFSAEFSLRTFMVFQL